MFSYFQIGLPKIKELENIFKNSDVNSWLTTANMICFQTKFSQNLEDANKNIKTFQDIRKEFNQLNQNFQLKSNFIEKIDKIWNNKFKDWREEQIQNWVKVHDFKAEKDEKFYYKIFAIFRAAFYICKEIYISDTQVLCAYLSLTNSINAGKIFQVSTGEGKSIIICMVAIAVALMGKKVDIITCSPVLAKRDAQQYSPIFKIFNLTCKHNGDTSNYTQGKKNCYEAQIVYGDAAQFQFDYLRHHYYNLQTLGNRNQEFVIIDETDYLLIDNSANIARLSSNVAGLDTLKPIYLFLWLELERLLQELLESQNQQYPQINRKEIEKKIKDELKNYIQNLLGSKIHIAKNLAKFVERQIPKWIDNAFLAYIFQEKVHYIVHDGKIKPVDYESTGLVLDQTSWSDGLHQFLQIKHGLALDSETLTTNFLSNIGFIKKYGSNLIGLTGTIGSSFSQKTLVEEYKVELVYIPHQKLKQFVEYPSIITNNQANWLLEICNSAIVETLKLRGVLILCESIYESEIVFQMLQQNYGQSSIRLYSRNNMNQEKNIQIIRQGDIFVATNLAGRGTDINTSQIRNDGGLHVILTFLPQNQRVQEQAFGRTSRQGDMGSGQMILNRQVLESNQDHSIKEIILERDEREKKKLEKLKNLLFGIQNKDLIFYRFCVEVKEIKERLQSIQNLKRQLTSNYIEELWASFIQKLDGNEKNEQDLNNFLADIKINILEEKFITNPYLHIQLGNDYFDKNDEKALSHYQYAIEIDQYVSYAAYLGISGVKIKQQAVNEAIPYLQNGIKYVENELQNLEEICQLLSQQQIFTDLTKQISLQINVLKSYSKNMVGNIAEIKKAKPIVEIRKIITTCGQQINQQSINVSFELIYTNLIQWMEFSQIQDQSLIILHTLTDTNQYYIEFDKIDQTILKKIIGDKLLEQELEHIKFNCQSAELDKESFCQFVDQTDESTIDVEITGNKEQLIQFLNQQVLQNVQVIWKNENEWQVYEGPKKEVVKIVQSCQISKIILRDIQTNVAIKISKENNFQTISIILNKISFQKLENIQTSFKVAIYNLNKKLAQSFLENARKSLIEFHFGVYNLNEQEAYTILNKELKEQEITLKKIVKLETNFQKSNNLEIELQEFTNRGLSFFLCIGEKLKSWQSFVQFGRKAIMRQERFGIRTQHLILESGIKIGQLGTNICIAGLGVGVAIVDIIFWMFAEIVNKQDQNENMKRHLEAIYIGTTTILDQLNSECNDLQKKNEQWKKERLEKKLQNQLHKITQGGGEKLFEYNIFDNKQIFDDIFNKIIFKTISKNQLNVLIQKQLQMEEVNIAGQYKLQNKMKCLVNKINDQSSFYEEWIEFSNQVFDEQNLSYLSENSMQDYLTGQLEQSSQVNKIIDKILNDFQKWLIIQEIDRLRFIKLMMNFVPNLHLDEALLIEKELFNLKLLSKIYLNDDDGNYFEILNTYSNEDLEWKFCENPILMKYKKEIIQLFFLLIKMHQKKIDLQVLCEGITQKFLQTMNQRMMNPK